MSEMTATGCCLRRAGSGEQVTVALGDKVRLANGWQGTAHHWTDRGVSVLLENVGLYAGGVRVSHVDVGDYEVDLVVTPAYSPGMTVECLDDSNGAHFLKLGKTYMVKSTQLDSNGELRLNLIGMARAWEVARFRRVD